MEENKEVLLTQEGFDKLEQELENLKTVKRVEIAERIKVALEIYQKILSMTKQKMLKQKMKQKLQN